MTELFCLGIRLQLCAVSVYIMQYLLICFLYCKLGGVFMIYPEKKLAEYVHYNIYNSIIRNWRRRWKNLLGELLLGPEIQTALNRKNKNKFFRRKNFLADFNLYNIYWKTTAVINNFSHFFSLSCFFLNVHFEKWPNYLVQMFLTYINGPFKNKARVILVYQEKYGIVLSLMYSPPFFFFEIKLMDMSIFQLSVYFGFVLFFGFL